MNYACRRAAGSECRFSNGANAIRARFVTGLSVPIAALSLGFVDKIVRLPSGRAEVCASVSFVDHFITGHPQESKTLGTRLEGMLEYKQSFQFCEAIKKFSSSSDGAGSASKAVSAACSC